MNPLKQNPYRLLSSVSHEIRNPVTLINSYLQLLSVRHPALLKDPYWDSLQSELSYLLKLLSDLSDFNNSSMPHLISLDMNQWLLHYSATARALVAHLGDEATTFCCRFSPNLPSVLADPVKIRQLLDNLIRNGIEAADGANTITLSAFCQKQTITLQVSDTGCGINHKDLSTIFDPFVSHKSSGTGLGLAICKQIADSHGGSLTASSRPGEGAVFSFTLPLSAAALTYSI